MVFCVSRRGDVKKTLKHCKNKDVEMGELFFLLMAENGVARNAAAA